MDNEADRLGEDVARRLEQEFRLIREAIMMVAAGYSERVVLASLAFAGELLDPARRVARDAAVSVTPLWSIDDACHSIAIERLPNASSQPATSL